MRDAKDIQLSAAEIVALRRKAFAGAGPRTGHAGADASLAIGMTCTAVRHLMAGDIRAFLTAAILAGEFAGQAQPAFLAEAISEQAKR
jgi:hypothetical protein